MIRNFIRALPGAAVLTIASASAEAHHPLGGGVPETFWHGFLSGVGHPMIGLDHFAFIIGVGLAAAFAARRFLSPLAFIVATGLGCLLHVAGIMLPLPELFVAASVVALGVVVLSGRTLPAPAQIGFFALAGLFHGFAYGGAVIGAEATPLLAYLAGFAGIQYLIVLATMLLVSGIWRVADGRAMQPRLAGAMVAGVGVAFLFGHLEGLVLG